MACTADSHNRLATVSSSAGSNIRACMSAGCAHVAFVPRGAGGASDNQGKHRHGVQLDKAQLAVKTQRDMESRIRGESRVLIVEGGKRRWGWL